MPSENNQKERRESKRKEEIKSKLGTEIKENGLKYALWSIGTLLLTGLLVRSMRLLLHMPAVIAGEAKKSDYITFNPFKLIITPFTSVGGFITLLFIILAIWMLWFYGIKPRMKETTGYQDDRNFRIAEEGTYGTSALMRRDEIENLMDWKDIEETEGIILGQLDGKVISLPSKKEFDAKLAKNHWGISELINNKVNNNLVVIGAPGTMKTRAFIRNAIIQAIKRGESIIITDPKGELVEDTAEYARRKGYKVRILNLVNLMSSDSWDCMATIGTDSIVAKIFADTVANNAGAGNDKYWVDNASIIFKAVSLYVMECPDEENKTMGRVYDILSGCDLVEIDNLFAKLPEKSVGKRAYNSFKRCNDNVKGQILNGISTMLAVFQDDTVRYITSSDEIDLEEVCYEKCAYYLIMSDQHSSFDFLAVLFYAMSFVKQVEAIDKERSKKSAGLPYRETIPINYLMDEFSNLGQIPNFPKKISTVRSRDINITMIIQNLAQLKNRYPNDLWQEILGCCDTTICLGCTDELTAEYISEKTGIATIEVESVNRSYDGQVAVLNQDTEYKEVKSRGQRRVMTTDEVMRMKNTDELVFIRGQKPLLCQKFDYTLNPESKNFVKTSVTDHKGEWRIRMEEEKQKGKENTIKANEKNKANKQAQEEEIKQKAERGEYAQVMQFGSGESPEITEITEIEEVKREEFFQGESHKIKSVPPKQSAKEEKTDDFINNKMNMMGLTLDSSSETSTESDSSSEFEEIEERDYEEEY